jgi:hypothetical protein
MRKLFVLLLFLFSGLAQAATGEMGTGVVSYLKYQSPGTGFPGGIFINGLRNRAIEFPSGCSYVWVSLNQVGFETLNFFEGILFESKTRNFPVRLFAQTATSHPCTVDTIEILPLTNTTPVE